MAEQPVRSGQSPRDFFSAKFEQWTSLHAQWDPTLRVLARLQITTGRICAATFTSGRAGTAHRRTRYTPMSSTPAPWLASSV